MGVKKVMLAKHAKTFILIVLFGALSPAVLGDSISAADLSARLGNDDGPLILDVRTEQEYRGGHVPGALNIPYNELENRFAELSTDKDQEIVVYCEVGGRAAVAAGVLEAAGFTRVRDLEGHMRKWRSENYPRE